MIKYLFDGNIIISDDGSVKRVFKKETKDIVMTLGRKTSRTKYFVYKKKRYLVSKTILDEFGQKPLKEDGSEYAFYKIVYKDKDRLNCSLSNLEYAYGDIELKASKKKLYNRGVIKLNRNKKSEEVYCIDTFLKLFDIYPNMRALAKALKISESTVRNRVKDRKLYRNRYLFSKGIEDGLL